MNMFSNFKANTKGKYIRTSSGLSEDQLSAIRQKIKHKLVFNKIRHYLEDDIIARAIEYAQDNDWGKKARLKTVCENYMYVKRNLDLDE